MLFLVLHRGLRQAAADACCTSMSTVARWLTAGWSPEPYTLDASVPGMSPEPVLAAPPPPPPTSLPAYTIRHTSMRVSHNYIIRRSERYYNNISLFRLSYRRCERVVWGRVGFGWIWRRVAAGLAGWCCVDVWESSKYFIVAENGIRNAEEVDGKRRLIRRALVALWRIGFAEIAVRGCAIGFLRDSAMREFAGSETKWLLGV